MAKSIRLLTQEINRIVFAPYAVLFKNLSHILAGLDDREILCWTVVKKCQIPALTAKILSSLEADAAALPVLLMLLRNVAIRDEMLKQDPEFTRKLFSGTANRQIYEACLNLCRFPFLESFAPPPEYFEFVDIVLTNDLSEPEDIWIEHARSLMSSMHPLTLKTIEANTMRRCISLCSECSKSSNNSTFIRFVSIAAVIHSTCSGQEPSSSCDTVSSPPSDPFSGWAAKCTTLFTGPKAHKILKSLLLRVLYFLSDKERTATTKMLHDLELVRQSVASMTQEVLDAAIQDLEVVQIMTKIGQKVGQPFSSTKLQLCVSGILLQLDPSCKLWDSAMLHSAIQLFLQEQLRPIGAQDPQKLLVTMSNLNFQAQHRDLFRHLATQYLGQKLVLQEIMQHLITLCRPGIYATAEVIYSLYSGGMFIDEVQHHFAVGNLCYDTLAGITAIDLPDWWSWELGSADTMANCSMTDVCLHMKDRIQRELSRDISDILLACNCTSELRMDISQYRSLMKIVSRSALLDSEQSCTWLIESQMRQQRPLGSDLCRKKAGNTKGVGDVLLQINQYTSETVLEYIDRTCRDLQERCYGIEAPLNVERTRCEALQKELDEARKAKDVALADNQARRLSWQHNIDIEQKEAAMLRDQQAELQRDLEQLNHQLKEASEQYLHIERTNADMEEQSKLMHSELEEHKVTSERFQQEKDKLAKANHDLSLQLKDAQAKEQKMLCVLQGHHENI